MPVKNRTYREERFAVSAGVTKKITFRDTHPNYFVIMSSSNATIYVSESAGVGAALYDIVIPAYGTRVFAKPNSLAALYFYCAADANIFIMSMETEFDPSMISQTQEISSSAAGGILGTVNIDEILNELPEGTKTLGGVIPRNTNGDELFSSDTPGIITDPATVSILAGLVNLASETTAAAILAKLEAGLVTTLSGSRVSVIHGAFAVGTTAVTKAINGKLCTVHVLSGNCWINPLDVAVADATSIKLSAANGTVMDLRVAENLSLISDATGSSVQIIEWE